MIKLDGKEFTDKESAYSYLNEKFSFIYYAENLDALYDCLTWIDDDIEILNYKDIAKNLGEYGCKFIRVFTDLATREDKNVNFISF